MARSRNSKRACLAEECAKGRAVGNEVSEEAGDTSTCVYSKCDEEFEQSVSVSKGGLGPPVWRSSTGGKDRSREITSAATVDTLVRGDCSLDKDGRDRDIISNEFWGMI